MPAPVDISYVDGEYLVFDIDAVKALRNEHHISGILVGTLPQVPQQSVFLGLPLQLMPEEAALLVHFGVARVLDEQASHDLILSEDGDDSAKDRITAAESGLQTFVTPAVTQPSDRAEATLPESSIAPILDTPRFQVYKYLHGKGFFLSPGLRFGSQFLAYPGDPLRYHSHYLVRGLAWDEDFALLDLIGSGRLGTGVKKAWMIGGRVPAGARREDYASFCVEWAGFG
ncbi:tRNA-splicing endonuclease subunit SEN34 [Myxozyma melibiosi]|uniref:tRNA-intron lyase n=1 Tax=Myxozyma melibiosi TaxID=54550 RepID=A0ABR1F0A9_9ASCO